MPARGKRVPPGSVVVAWWHSLHLDGGMCWPKGEGGREGRGGVPAMASGSALGASPQALAMNSAWAAA